MYLVHYVSSIILHIVKNIRDIQKFMKKYLTTNIKIYNYGEKK